MGRVKFCFECHQLIRHRLNMACREYCSEACKDIARKRRQERDGFGLFLAQQRARVRAHLRDELHAYRHKKAAAQENSLTSAYTLEQRGWTYGGTPARAKFQIQED